MQVADVFKIIIWDIFTECQEHKSSLPFRHKTPLLLVDHYYALNKARQKISLKYL
jgi:hypothetical protein